MAEHPDAQLVRQGYDAFIAGDMEWLNEHFAETIVWHVAGNNALAGDYRGREEVLAFFARSVRAATPNFDVHDVVAGEDHTVALVNIRFTRTDNGRTFEGRTVQVLHIENGKALESWTLAEDQAGLDTFLELPAEVGRLVRAGHGGVDRRKGDFDHPLRYAHRVVAEPAHPGQSASFSLEARNVGLGLRVGGAPWRMVDPVGVEPARRRHPDRAAVFEVEPSAVERTADDEPIELADREWGRHVRAAIVDGHHPGRCVDEEDVQVEPCGPAHRSKREIVCPEQRFERRTGRAGCLQAVWYRGRLKRHRGNDTAFG